ncbi:hypothetical protein RCL_jg28169.t1 [Rhizophagus clarus]|uniref:Uncharacterized protein n=1 Tax=Rhizophagus clarus TaxID=94130 RepID=A0A8H3LX77_9GLOM|nr:hypothetical protein RCL_jg28169.t1 [Rhizophagus clarus]
MLCGKCFKSWSLHEEVSLERGRRTSRSFRLERSPHQEEILSERSRGASRSFCHEKETSLERGRKTTRSFRQGHSSRQEETLLERGRSASRFFHHKEEALLESGRRTSRYQKDVSLEKSKNTFHSFHQEEEALQERSPFRLKYGSLNGTHKRRRLEEECSDDEVRTQEKNRKKNWGREEEIRNQEEITKLRSIISNIGKEFKELWKNFQASNQNQIAPMAGHNFLHFLNP